MLADMHTLLYWLEIVFLLIGILVACQVFTNAIENLGEALNLNHEFTGSILAAVGTALPETILPLVAIFMATSSAGAGAKNDIAIGAIIGAPFMLATLAMFLLGLSIFTHQKTRSAKFGASEHLNLQVNVDHLKRDLIYFLITFSLALGATFLASEYVSRFVDYLCTQEWGVRLIGLFHASSLVEVPTACYGDLSSALKFITAIVIGSSYFIYVAQSYKNATKEFESEPEDIPELYLTKIIPIPVKNNILLPVIIQTLLGLAGIIYFAHHFVHGVEHIAEIFSISPLILSLIISPIATELPEKVNSWIWSSEGKDTLAMGNLSGAMVFQSAIPSMIGVMLTPWILNESVLICAGLSIASALILLSVIQIQKKINYKVLLGAGSLYIVYLIYILGSL
jgi:cation:H+ antiporter